jgi:heme oxygenase (mycobilin-producing)
MVTFSMGKNPVEKKVYKMIKVLITRKYDKDQVALLQPLLKDLYVEVNRHKGFVSAESLVNDQDPTEHLIISMWNSMEEWTAYNESENIQSIRTMIDHALGQHTSRKVYTQEN